MADEQARVWEFAHAPAGCAPGVASIVGYRALQTPNEVHRGMPSAKLTFIVSRDDGVREPWGVRRFFVRAPDGNVLNIVGHSD